jgi:hypothetical protein
MAGIGVYRPKGEARRVRLSWHPHPLFGRPTWALVRICDDHIEAHGFASSQEACDWAAELGYEVEVVA